MLCEERRRIPWCWARQKARLGVPGSVANSRAIRVARERLVFWSVIRHRIADLVGHTNEIGDRLTLSGVSCPRFNDQPSVILAWLVHEVHNKWIGDNRLSLPPESANRGAQNLQAVRAPPPWLKCPCGIAVPPEPQADSRDLPHSGLVKRRYPRNSSALSNSIVLFHEMTNQLVESLARRGWESNRKTRRQR